MNNMTICINSSHRASINTTFAALALCQGLKVRVAVPRDQMGAYRATYPRHVLWPIPGEVRGFLPSQRQWCIENCSTKYILFMDDDLSFQKRDNEMKLQKCETEEDIYAMLFSVYEALDYEGINLVGISTRLGNNRVTEDYTENTRVTRCYGLNTEVFLDLGINIAPFEPFVMEDFLLNLELLTRGHKNRVYYNYAQSDSGSNSEGGCSVYRDSEAQEKTAIYMGRRFPNFVTVKKKRTKGGWDGFEKDSEGYVVRTDVIVQWKKAFDSHVNQSKRGAVVNKFFRK